MFVDKQKKETADIMRPSGHAILPAAMQDAGGEVAKEKEEKERTPQFFTIDQETKHPGRQKDIHS
jgi:hypothetical protein